MKTKSSKAKGRSLQNWVRDKILSCYPTLDALLDVRGCLMGDKGEDIKLSEKARLIFPFSVECKSRKAIAIYTFWQQAEANCGDYTPLLFIKQNRGKPLVVMDAEVFFEKLNQASKPST